MTTLEEINVDFPSELQHEACLLAAFDIIKCLFDAGKISEYELNYIKKKYCIGDIVV